MTLKGKLLTALVLLMQYGIGFGQSEDFQSMLNTFSKSCTHYNKGLKDGYKFFESSAVFLNDAKIKFNVVKGSLQVKQRDTILSAFSTMKSLLDKKAEYSTDNNRKIGALLLSALMDAKVSDVGYEVYSASPKFILNILKPTIKIESVEDREDIIQITTTVNNTSSKTITNISGLINFYIVFRGDYNQSKAKIKIDTVINLAPGKSKTLIRYYPKRAFEKEITYESMNSNAILPMLIPEFIFYSDGSKTKHDYFPINYATRYYNLYSVSKEMMAKQDSLETSKQNEWNAIQQERALKKQKQEQETDELRKKQEQENAKAQELRNKKYAILQNGIKVSLVDAGKLETENKEKIKGYAVSITNNTGKAIKSISGEIGFEFSRYQGFPLEQYQNYLTFVNSTEEIPVNGQATLLQANDAFADEMQSIKLKTKLNFNKADYLSSVNKKLRIREIVFTDGEVLTW